ncbi:estradiol 17-beta-dehydrogenase 1 [Latimeria chalumnae]|uniref:estradiol 17-beta-dehydrogenase 1 n=1 Tax=Latimeria chalumnae TaxID=7897 RepID=UPI0003C1498E|nr:PREDICTED: estradiol 17-beta-dehydrogenase 1 [Latimeria chalumnae]|eukprot:XP_006004321.1 PREDICTED: estradiol 17-beta-dehydrogenase 1 [Latimeria chalumnae]
MEKTVVFITGCSSGIGLGLALRLASDPSNAFKVYATMRDLSKSERLLQCVKECHPDTLEILQMDVTDQQSIALVQQKIKELQVDVLVCNAGVGWMGPLESHSHEAVKQLFDVNVFGTISTIQTFLPAMKQRRSGRIIISGSLGGLQGVPFTDVYCASKFAVEGLCESLAIVLQHFNICVSLIECGPVNTSFKNKLYTAETEESKLQHVDPKTRALYQQYLRHCENIFQDAAQDTEEVVQIFMEAITAPSPALRYYTNHFFMPLTKLKMSITGASQYVQAMNRFVFSSGATKDDPVPEPAQLGKAVNSHLLD